MDSLSYCTRLLTSYGFIPTRGLISRGPLANNRSFRPGGQELGGQKGPDRLAGVEDMKFVPVHNGHFGRAVDDLVRKAHVSNKFHVFGVLVRDDDRPDVEDEAVLGF